MSFLLLTMQSYGDFLPIPRKIPNSSLTCSDNHLHRRHIRQMPSKPVVSGGRELPDSCRMLCFGLRSSAPLRDHYEAVGHAKAYDYIYKESRFIA